MEIGWRVWLLVMAIAWSLVALTPKKPADPPFLRGFVKGVALAHLAVGLAGFF